MPTADSPLRGTRVLVTRPAPQAGALMALIRGSGGEPVPFPTLEIMPVRPQAPVLEALAGCDTLIFVSANAVRHGHHLLPPGGSGDRTLAAVGPATRRALADTGHTGVVYPGHDASSEGLLRLASFRDVAGRRIGIMRGRGGRDTLKLELSQRGARVWDVDCYERRLPLGYDPAVVTRELARADTPLVVTATSVTGLDNLLAMTPPDSRRALLSRPLVVIGERQRQAAREHGWRGEVLVSAAADDRVAETIAGWRRQDVNSI